MIVFMFESCKGTSMSCFVLRSRFEVAFLSSQFVHVGPRERRIAVGRSRRFFFGGGGFQGLGGTGGAGLSKLKTVRRHSVACCGEGTQCYSPMQFSQHLQIFTVVNSLPQDQNLSLAGGS